MPILGELSSPELVFPDLDCADARTLLEAMAQRIAATGRIDDAGALLDKLLEREALGSTGIGDGVAIPHCKLSELDDGLLAVGITRHGIDFSAVDGKTVQLFFLLVSPADDPALHLRSLASISKWLKKGDQKQRLVQLRDPAAIFDAISRAADA